MRASDDCCVPPLTRALSEYVGNVKDTKEVLQLLSKFKVTNVDTTQRSQLKSAKDKYDVDFHPTRAILVALDNINIKHHGGIFNLDRVIAGCYCGVNYVSHQVEFDVPLPSCSFIRRDISTLTPDFIQPPAHCLQELTSFISQSTLRAIKYFLEVPVVNGFCSVVNLLDDGIDLSSDDPISKINPMEIVIGLNTTRPSWKLADLKQRVMDGDVESETVLKELFEKLINEYKSSFRQRLLSSADQAIFTVFQDFRVKPEWNHIESVICLDMELWHVVLGMARAIAVAYRAPLRPLVALIGIVTQKDYDRFANCGNLRSTFYIMECIDIAVISEMFDFFLDENPDWDFIRHIDSAEDLNDVFISDLDREFNAWLNQKLEANPYLRLWYQYHCAFTYANATWVSQRIGNHNLYRASISVKGFLPLYWVWNRNRYDHSVSEQHREYALACPYEEYIRSSGGQYIRFENSPVMRAHGDWQEYSVKLAKGVTHHMDPQGKALHSALPKLVPVETNRRNLEKLAEMPPRNKHKFHYPQLDIINNIRYVFRLGNLLGRESRDVSSSSPAPVVSPASSDPVVSPTDFMSSIYLPDDFSDDPFSKLISVLHFGQCMPVSSDYWLSYPTAYVLHPVDPKLPFHCYYSRVPANEKFTHCFSEGTIFAEAHAVNIIQSRNIGNTKELKKKLKDKRQIHYIDKTQKDKLFTPHHYDVESRKAMAEADVLSTQKGKQDYDVQFSIDGLNRHAPQRNQLRLLLKSHFDGVFLARVIPSQQDLFKYYNAFFIVGNGFLYLDFNKTRDVTEQTTGFCQKIIKPLLLSSSFVVMAFNYDPHVTGLKGQVRYERDSAISEKIPLTVRLSESENTVPRKDVRQESRPARAHFAKQLIKCIFSDPKKFLPLSDSDYIVVFSGLGINNDEQLPISIHYSSNSSQFTCLTCPGIQVQSGLADDALFEIASRLFPSPTSERLAFASSDPHVLIKSLALSSSFSSSVEYIHWKLEEKLVFERYSIPVLASAIRSRCDTQYPILSMVTLFLDGGFSSFTSKFYGYTLQTTLRVTDEFPSFDFVGPVSESDLDPELISLLELQPDTIIPLRPSLKKFQFNRLASNKDVANSSCTDFDSLFNISLDQKNIRKVMPTAAGFNSHYLRLVAAFLHFTHVLPIVRNEHLCALGFRLLDPSRPCSVTNCGMDFHAASSITKSQITKSRQLAQKSSNTNDSQFDSQHLQTSSSSDDPKPKKQKKADRPKCQQVLKNGKPCSFAAGPSGFCGKHKPKD